MPWTKELRSGKNMLQKQKGEVKSPYDFLVISLFPMVERILVELGEALWGKRSFVRNFRFKSYKKAGHQTWEIQRGLFSLQISNRVSVMLSKDMKQFYICCDDIVDYRNCSVEDSHGLSEQALTESLLKACKKRKWRQQN
jgi:hypothetical protein